jgi:ADP-ribose pyrophosphatase
VEHPGGVGIVAVDDDKNVLLVEQFRKPYDKMIVEIPAGKLEKGESPELCGRRELEEEAGFTAESFEFLGECYPSVGYTDEIIRIFLATGLKKTHTHPDEDEFLNVIKIPLDEMFSKVMNNEIADAKTIIGVLKAYIKLSGGKK